jgi:hypothetical protein
MVAEAEAEAAACRTEPFRSRTASPAA